MKLSFPFWLADVEKVAETEAMGFGPWRMVEPEDCSDLDETTRAAVRAALARDPDLGLFRFAGFETRTARATGCTGLRVDRTSLRVGRTGRRASRQS